MDRYPAGMAGDTSVLERLKAGLRALGSGAPVGVDGSPGSLRAVRGLAPGTSSTSDPLAAANEGRANGSINLAENAHIQFTLTIVDAVPSIGAPAAKRNSDSAFSLEMPLVAFGSGGAERLRVLEALRGSLPQTGFWSLGLTLTKLNPRVWTFISPQSSVTNLGYFPAGRDLVEHEVIAALQAIWIAIQAGLATEMDFRRRYGVTTAQAAMFYKGLFSAKGYMPVYKLLDQWEKLHYEELLDRHGLSLEFTGGLDLFLRQGYLNLACHCLKKGDEEKAVDYATLALREFATHPVPWIKGGSTVHRWHFDNAVARKELGSKEKRVLTRLARLESKWQELGERRWRTVMRLSLTALEGGAVWRELLAYRMIEDGRATSLVDGLRATPQAIRARYLSKHESNPYRRGLEQFELIGEKTSECFPNASIVNTIVKQPLAWLEGGIPIRLFEKLSATSPWSPDLRLHKLATAEFPNGNDIEEILLATHAQVDKDISGLVPTLTTPFKIAMLEDFQL
jgi:hypothetical protein